MEYVRNLTPQILLLALAIVLWIRVDTSTPDLSWNGLGNVAAPMLLFGLLLLAVWFNAQQLLERALLTSEEVDVEFGRLANARPSALGTAVALVEIIWRHHKSCALRTFLVLSTIFAGTVAVFTAAVPQALQLLRSANN